MFVICLVQAVSGGSCGQGASAQKAVNAAVTTVLILSVSDGFLRLKMLAGRWSKDTTHRLGMLLAALHYDGFIQTSFKKVLQTQRLLHTGVKKKHPSGGDHKPQRACQPLK